MGGMFGSPTVPQVDNVLVSWGRITLPPVVWAKRYSPNELETRFEGFESVNYHVLWQDDVPKGVRYVIDVDVWPKKGSRVFSE